MWQADGWGWRARIGVLTPHADIGPESEFRAMAPEGVSIHAARIPLAVMVPGASPYLYAQFRHRDLARALGLPERLCVLGYLYVEQGDAETPGIVKTLP